MIRNVKNTTTSTIEICGTLIPGNATVDLLASCTMIELTESNELITCLANETLKLETEISGQYYSSPNAIRIVQNIPQIFPTDDQGKMFIVNKSMFNGFTTCFTHVGDNLTTGEIGGGPPLSWDTSYRMDSYWQTYEDNPNIPIGFKRHTAKIQFIDEVQIKEGTVYYEECLPGSYIDMKLECPPTYVFMYKGVPYINMTGQFLVIEHYVINHPIQNNVPMGDELNTEVASQVIPSYMIFKLDVTVPSHDKKSRGYFQLEIHRQRTVNLDNLIDGNDIVPYTS